MCREWIGCRWQGGGGWRALFPFVEDAVEGVDGVELGAARD